MNAELAALDTVVFGLSPDPQAKLQKFIDKHALNFDLLSDEEYQVAEQYGVWDRKNLWVKNLWVSTAFHLLSIKKGF